jgi:hypothetical protein
MVDDQSFTGLLRPIPDDPGDGLVRVPLPHITWVNDSTLTVELPADIVVGVYDVVVTHASGATSTLPHGFVSLGRDTTSPTVSIQGPGKDGLIGAGSEVEILLAVDDGLGRVASLSWSVDLEAGGNAASGTCPPPPSSGPFTCIPSFTAPMPSGQSEVLFISAIAVDAGGNPGSTREPYLLVPSPVVSDMDPRLGPSQGGTIVTIRGSNFLNGLNGSPGTQVFFGDIEAAAVHASTSSQLLAESPPGSPGFFPVSVRNGGASTLAGMFEYLGGPTVRAIDPPAGPVEGGIWITVVGNNFREGTTQIRFGSRNLDCLVYKSAQRIEGLLPAAGSSGLVTVAAFDSLGGPGRPFPNPFVYYVNETTDGGVASAPADGGACTGRGGP